MKIDIIAGARPNFMKIAPIIEAIKNAKLKGSSLNYRLIHTGQHYDKKMSGSFFEELGIPEPDVNLGAGGGSQAEQTAAIMIGYEKLLAEKPVDLCLVVGDVTSTMACAIVAKKANIKVAHVEAGIRSGDLSMPEEINRLVTDAITDIFYTTSAIANENIRKSGVAEDKIVFVGNTMIDTLLKNLPKLKKPALFLENKLAEKNYFVMTLHRPANVDGEEKLKELLTEIKKEMERRGGADKVLIVSTHDKYPEFDGVTLDKAAKALKLGIKNIVFDRNGYKYHGRVLAVAKGAREAGLIF